MRRLLFALLFPLLLISQQGAFVHGLEHLPGSVQTSRTQDDRHAPGDQYCEKCFSFAQIGAAAGLKPALAAFLASSFERSASDCRSRLYPASRSPAAAGRLLSSDR